MSAEYNLPLHVSTQNGDDYVIEDSYPHDGVTSPGMGWDGQSDGGGKFRLKRRRRCGQCGPCQVKENCNKCQYCLRKDVLKQACVYRKCVYLRKPVPRFRQEPTSGGGVSHNKSAPTPPRKPTTTPVPPASSNGGNSNSNSSSNTGGHNPGNNTTTPAPASAISSPASVPSNSSSHPSELSSCRLNQSPFAALSAMQGMNPSVLDPLRHRMMEHQHRSSLFDSMSHHHQVLDHAKQAIGDMSRYPGGPAASGAHCKLDQSAAAMNHTNDMNLAAAAAAAAAAASPLNSMSSHHAHHQSNKTSGLSTRDPYFPTMDTWSSMSYALPRATTWATSTLPNHHAAAAAYGFQQHSTPFPSSFAPSSCRLGLPDAGTSRFGSPSVSQHTFHHSMGGMAGFSQDLSHATANHANHANMRSMNAPFYPPPSHIPPSSIPSFPGLGQFPTNQASFGPTAYPMHPHAHMYPSGFYSTFRSATEPQIYHAQVYPSQNPFKHSLSQISSFSSSFFGEKSVNPEKKFGLALHKIGEFNDLPFGYNAGEIELCGENKLGFSYHLQVEEIVNNKLSQADTSNAHSLNIPSLSKTFPEYFEKCRVEKRQSVSSKVSKLTIKKSVSLLHHNISNGSASSKPSLNQHTIVDTNGEKLAPGRMFGKGSRKSFQSHTEIDKDLMDRLNQFSHVSDSATCQHHNELLSVSHGRLDEICNSDDVDNTLDTTVKCDDLAFTDNISLCAPQSSLPPSTLWSSFSGKKLPSLPPVISTAAFISSNALPSFQPAAQVTDSNGGTDELVKAGRIPCTKLVCIGENQSSSIGRRHLKRSSPCLKPIKLKHARTGEMPHVFSVFLEPENQADSVTVNHSAISVPKIYENEQLGSDPTPPFTSSSPSSLHSVSCPLWESLSDLIMDPCSDPSLSNEQK